MNSVWLHSTTTVVYEVFDVDTGSVRDSGGIARCKRYTPRFQLGLAIQQDSRSWCGAKCVGGSSKLPSDRQGVRLCPAPTFVA